MNLNEDEFPPHMAENLDKVIAQFTPPAIPDWTQREALIELRRVMEAVPPNLINMSYWFHRTRQENAPLYTKDTEGDDLCGTTACVGGHAALDKWFSDRGLALLPPDTPDDERPSLVFRRPGKPDLRDFDALQCFFRFPELRHSLPSEDPTYRLFSPQAYPTPSGNACRRRVIDRITYYINFPRHVGTVVGPVSEEQA